MQSGKTPRFPALGGDSYRPDILPPINATMVDVQSHLDTRLAAPSPSARYSAILYARAEDLPALDEIAIPGGAGGALDARFAAVDEKLRVIEGQTRLGIGRFVAVNEAGFVVRVAVQTAPKAIAHHWLTHKEELGYTPEDFTLCTASRFEISVQMLTPLPVPQACAAVRFQAELVDRLALLTKAVVLDVDAGRFTSPVRRRIPDALWPFDVREHIGFQAIRKNGWMSIRTRGMVKFGCPELEAERLPEQMESLQMASAALADIAQQMVTGTPAQNPERIGNARDRAATRGSLLPV